MAFGRLQSEEAKNAGSIKLWQNRYYLDSFAVVWAFLVNRIYASYFARFMFLLW